MFEVWQSVKVKNPEHARTGEAGIVFSVDPAHPDEVAVRFDTDLQVQLVLCVDLVQL